jgi:hypothetical protein
MVNIIRQLQNPTLSEIYCKTWRTA